MLDMTQSVERMKDVVQSSPRAQALLEHHPQALNDPEQLQHEMQNLQRMSDGAESLQTFVGRL